MSLLSEVLTEIVHLHVTLAGRAEGGRVSAKIGAYLMAVSFWFQVAYSYSILHLGNVASISHNV